MSARVGFIGLGAIGRPMAAHVAGRFETALWNRTAAKAEELAGSTGATVMPDVASLVAWADVIVTCLPTSAEVAEVLSPAQSAWRTGQLVVDCTSGDPETSRALAAELAAHGVDFVDAPVSGGTSGAVAGKLTVMLGGADSAVMRAQEIVDAFAAKVTHVGPVGAGHAVKAANNALLAVNIQAVGEVLAGLVKLGVPAAKALEVINASSGRSNVTENLIGERVLSRAWPRTFRLALLDKDVGIALKMLEDADVPREAISVTKRAFGEGRTALGEEADHVELIKGIERRAGVEIH